MVFCSLSHNLSNSDIDISRQLLIWCELRDTWKVLSIQLKYFFYMEATLEFILMLLLDKRKFILSHLGGLERAEEEVRSAERRK